MDAVKRDIRDCLREFMNKHNLLAMRVSYVQDFELSEHADYWAVQEKWIDAFKDIVRILVTLQTPGLTKLYARSLSSPSDGNGTRKLTYKIDHSNAQATEMPDTLTDEIDENFWSDLLPEPEHGILYIQNILEKLKSLYSPSHEEFTKTIQDHGVVSKKHNIRFIIAGLPSIDPYSSAGYFGRSFWMTAIEPASDPVLLTEEAALEWLFDPRTSYTQDELPFFIRNPDDLYRSCSTMLSGKFVSNTKEHDATDGKGNISPYWARHHNELDESLSGISNVLERIFGSRIFTEALAKYEPLKKVCCAKSFRDAQGLWLPFLTEIFQPRNFSSLPVPNGLFWRIRTNRPGHILINLRSLQQVLQPEHEPSKLKRCDFDMSPKNARVSMIFTECSAAMKLAAEIATIEGYTEKGNLREVLKNLQINGVEVTACSNKETLTINLRFKLEKMN